MPKMKTSKAAAKRFKATGTGKLKRSKAYKSHILTKKTTKRKRNLTSVLMTKYFFMTLKGSLRYVYLFVTVIKRYYHLWNTCVSQAL